MTGTDVVPDASSGGIPRSVPPAIVSIRVDGIRAFRTYDDDDGPVLVITDGDATVEFLCGFSGRSPAAILGAERLAEATRAYSHVIETNDDDAAGSPQG